MGKAINKQAPQYEFSEQGSTDDDGFNDGGTTQFDHDIPRSVARESIQNILDARDKSLGQPAIATFELEYIKPKDVLEHAHLLRRMRACLKASRDNIQSARFFCRAVQHLESDREIPVLRVSDFNTVGLTGDDEDTAGNYRNFLKAAGSTNKVGSAGGSFGLGKGAFIAASSFRTIFVASRFVNGRQVGNLFQGKCRLISHQLNGSKYRGMGSFGLPGEKPIRNVSDIPEKFIRPQNGTDVYILGLRGYKHWKEDMMRHVLDHFWRAIQKGNLEVVIDRIAINADNVESKLFEVFDLKSVYKKHDQNPIPFFQAHKNGQVIKKTLPTIGKVQCHILAAEGYPNQIYCTRATGMKIEQRDFRSVVQFAGVFECDSETGNNLLKLLEPPNHNEWSLENSNAKDPEGEPLPEAKRAYDEFYKFCRECVGSLIDRQDRSALQIRGLEKYLYLPSAEEELMEAALNAEIDKSKISDHETGTEGPFLDAQRPVVTPPRKLTVTNQRGTGSEDGGKAITLKPGDSPPPPKRSGVLGTRPGTGGSKTGSEGDGENKIWLAVDAKHRGWAVSDKNGIAQHVIVIRGEKEKEYFVRLMVGTDDNYDKIPISSVLEMSSGQLLTFKDNLISGVRTDRAGEARISVAFVDGQQYALNVGIYEG